MDSLLRKWLNRPKADDKSLLARFYHADKSLRTVASELDSFDGRAEPERCSRLVGRLRQGQDKLLAIINQIMDELLKEDRSPRAFRAKFPEEVLQESLAGQLWFGAECLAAGSSIMNREIESAEIRPLAKAVTKSLDTVRNLLCEQCLRNNTPNSPTLKLDINDAATEQLYESLKIFDRLFAEFELLYVSAMVQVKSKHEHEVQELICVLFSETLQRALKIRLLEQEQVDSYDPSLMFSIPRLAIIAGLIIFNRGPLDMNQPADQMSELFRPFRKLLMKMRDLLRTLSKNELYQLEKMLCTNEDINLNKQFICDDDDRDVAKNVNSNVNYNNSCDTNNKESINTVRDLLNHRFFTQCENLCDRKSDWQMGDDEDDDNDEYLDDYSENANSSLMITECTSGYLIPNTNFGNLLQTTETPLTDSFISSDDEGSSNNKIVINDSNNNSANTYKNSDIETKNTNLKQSPNSELQIPPQTDNRNNNTLPRKYNESCKKASKCSKSSSSSSSKGINNKMSESDGEGDTDSTLCENNFYDEKPTTSHHRPIVRKHNRKTAINNSKKSINKVAKNSSVGSDTSPSESTCSESNDTAMKTAGKNSTENLLHRLFVCIAGVADQLQTNFAADLRQILKSVFLINVSPSENEITIEGKCSETSLFEFRASENDVIQENAGSNQSIYSSAEEANPDQQDLSQENESNHRDIEFFERTVSVPIPVQRCNQRTNPERSVSLGDATIDHSSTDNTLNRDRNRRHSNVNTKEYGRSRSNGNSPINNNSSRRQAPPTWIPDSEAPRCMACSAAFTAFRRRHHCRNCGKVFCGICSNSSVPLPKFGLIKAVRVCSDCYDEETRT